MDDDIYWQDIENIRIPLIFKLLSFTRTKIVFNGLFYLEDGAMPVERICHINDRIFHIRILEKRTINETHENNFFTRCTTIDNIDRGVSFFPSAVIELKYKILKDITFCDEYLYARIIKRILDENKNVEMKSDFLQRMREDDEFMNSMEKHCKIRKIENDRAE